MAKQQTVQVVLDLPFEVRPNFENGESQLLVEVPIKPFDESEFKQLKKLFDCSDRDADDILRYASKLFVRNYLSERILM